MADFSFSSPQVALKAALATVLAVVERRSSMPVLTHVLVAVRGGVLSLSTTDLRTAVTVPVPAGFATDGATCVNAQKFAEVVKSLPRGASVACTLTTPTSFAMACEGSRFTLPAIKAEDFPALPSTGAWTDEMDADALASVIDATKHAMSTDDTRPHLNSMLLERDSTRLRAVTTDGHRMAIQSRDVSNGDPWTALVSPKTVEAVLRLASGKGDAKIAIARVRNGNDTTIFFRRNGVVVSGVLRDEQFPPYAKVIPQMQDRTIVIGRKAFSGALKRVAVTASDRSGGVRIAVGDGCLKIDSENPDAGRTCETIDATVHGRPVTVGFNARYLLDALAAVEADQVTLSLSGELDPGTIRAEAVPGYIAVTMPMRI